MKYVFVLTLLAALAGLAYWRLRPYIKAVRRFLGVVRQVNAVREGRPAPDLPRGAARPRARGEKLARCAACGTWMPSARAVTLRATGVSYCSHACLERAADSPHGARKSAS